ncbi:MAG TPA: hypothetical protein VNL17_14620 [Verrucomicrobiae bacterium]|nr:hypothetical protein [Verrucomicrobiae bacterium]
MSCPCPECNNDWGGTCLYEQIKTAKQERDSALAKVTEKTNEVLALIRDEFRLVAKLAEQAALVERLRAALEPFAAYGETLESVNWLPDECPVSATPEAYLTASLRVKHLRRAHEVYAGIVSATPAAALEAHDRELLAGFALKSHKWTGCRAGGDPTEAGSNEWIRYCEVCGMEDTCEDPLPPCPPFEHEWLKKHDRELLERVIHEISKCTWAPGFVTADRIRALAAAPQAAPEEKA